MERWIAVGVASLALLVSMFNLWTFKGIDARLDALELVGRGAPRAVAVPVPAPAAEARSARRVKAKLKDPEVREVAKERLAELTSGKQAKRVDQAVEARAELTREVQAFAVEENVDEATVGLVLGLLEGRSDAFHTVREDVRSGALSRMDGRLELKAELEASEADLRDVLGDELFEVLDQRLWADKGRPR